MNKKLIALTTVLVISLASTIVYKKYTKAPVINNPNPRSEHSWVGDVMPFFDGKSWQIFYLEDHRDGEIGFHPFSLFTTQDFIKYEDYGVVIPYVNEEDSQERALGTGSIIQDENGLYHAFYTAHNGSLKPKEAIMHASSKDLKKWKKHQEETFFGSEQYQRDDFRDPFVFYNEEKEEYWMLITTRKDNNGVIAKYTSKNLKDWQDEGVFFENDMGTDGNLECPSLVYYNGKWYLAFSDQWPDRVTHYRVADSLDGPFEKPSNIDHWDSNAFYAGQIQKDTEGNLYVFAWIPTKENHDDNKPYNWAGNLAIHQLVQDENGHLQAQLPLSIKSFLETKNSPRIIEESEQKISFKQEDDISLLQTTINYDEQASFGFSFNTNENDDSGLNVIIENGTIQFQNNTLKYVDRSQALSKMDLVKNDGEIKLDIVLNGEIIIFYINEEQAFSTRMLNAKNKNFTFFVRKGNAKLTLDTGP